MFVHKVDMPNSITICSNQTTTCELYVVWCGSKNRNQKDMCLKLHMIGLHAQNFSNHLKLNGQHNWRERLTWPFDEHENLHFDDEWIRYSCEQFSLITSIARQRHSVSLQLYVRLSVYRPLTEKDRFDVLVALIDAQVFAYMGQLEFFYDQVPDNMQSIGTALFTSNTGVAHFLCTAILHIVTSVTGRDGHKAWVVSSINNSRLDKYYWMLTALSAVNFLAFLAVSQWYTYKVATRLAPVDQKKVVPEKAAPVVEWFTGF